MAAVHQRMRLAKARKSMITIPTAASQLAFKRQQVVLPGGNQMSKQA